MRTNERGSVVRYVLGVVVLSGLLLGGILLYKNYSANTSDTSGDQVANQTETSDSDDQAAQNEAALKQQQEEAEKKAQEQNQASGGDTSSTATETPHTSTVPSGSLPETGPAEDVLLSAAGVAVLAGVGVAYARSRAAL